MRPTTLWMEIRERRAQLSSMDHYNALAQVRVPNSLFELGRRKDHSRSTPEGAAPAASEEPRDLRRKGCRS